MLSSLNSVFNSVLALTEDAAGATLVKPDVQNGSSLYQVQYSSNGWVGNVFGRTLSFDTFGNPTVSPVWDAQSLLDAKVAGTGWDTGRVIATWNGTQGVPFRLGSLIDRAGTTLPRPQRGGPAAAAQLPARRPLERGHAVPDPHARPRRHRRLGGDAGGSAARSLRRRDKPRLLGLQVDLGEPPGDPLRRGKRRHAPRLRRRHFGRPGWRSGAFRLRPEFCVQRSEQPISRRSRRRTTCTTSTWTPRRLRPTWTSRGRAGIRR